MTTKKEKYSVFTEGYIPEPTKTVEASGSRTAFLMIAEDSVNDLAALGFSQTQATDLTNNGFWRLVVTNISENHDEGLVLHNTLSDTIGIFSTGALPIAVTVNGFLLTTPGNDDRNRFLKLYADRIRGRVLDRTRSILLFGFKDTVMRLFITQLGVTNAAGNEAFTNIVFTAVASNYSCGLPAPVSEEEEAAAGAAAPEEDLGVLEALQGEVTSVMAGAAGAIQGQVSSVMAGAAGAIQGQVSSVMAGAAGAIQSKVSSVMAGAAGELQGKVTSALAAAIPGGVPPIVSGMIKSQVSSVMSQASGVIRGKVTSLVAEASVGIQGKVTSALASMGQAKAATSPANAAFSIIARSR